MSKLLKFDVVLLVVLLLGTAGFIVYYSWVKKHYNHIHVINNYRAVDGVSLTCFPNIKCKYWINKGKSERYEHLASISVNRDQGNLRYTYTVSFPDKGNFSIKLNELFRGKLQSKLKVTCSVATYQKDYLDAKKVKCGKAFIK